MGKATCTGKRGHPETTPSAVPSRPSRKCPSSGAEVAPGPRVPRWLWWTSRHTYQHQGLRSSSSADTNCPGGCQPAPSASGSWKGSAGPHKGGIEASSPGNERQLPRARQGHHQQTQQSAVAWRALQDALPRHPPTCAARPGDTWSVTCSLLHQGRAPTGAFLDCGSHSVAPGPREGQVPVLAQAWARSAQRRAGAEACSTRTTWSASV